VKPGDVGYLIFSHGVPYARESGYSQEFEGYVMKTFYEFLEHYDTAKTQYVVPYNEEIVSCIAILSKPDNRSWFAWLHTTGL
jgi:hypothetical protein